MDQRDLQLHTRSRSAMGALLLLLWLTVMLGTLGLFVGTSFARYQSSGSASVRFAAGGKPQVTVAEQAGASDGRSFTVTCNRQTEGTGVRIRLYGSGKELTSLSLHRSDDSSSYSVVPLELNQNSPQGRETKATLVYVLKDENGNEILFDTATQAMSFVLKSADANTDISQLQICAEAVRE